MKNRIIPTVCAPKCLTGSVHLLVSNCSKTRVPADSSALSCALPYKACVFLPVSHILQALFPTSQQLDCISSCYLLRSKKVASELRRGRPVQGHLDGGRERLLATRVSRSVRLSVCEAVIRFQDFPSVTGLLTKPYTPLHVRNQLCHLNLSTLGLLHLSGQEPQPPATTPKTPTHLLTQCDDFSVSGLNVK